MSSETKLTTYPVAKFSNFENIDAFFQAISYKLSGYLSSTFSYVAVKTGDDYFLLQGRVFLSATESQAPFTHFQSEHIRAGHYTLPELQLSAAELVTQLTLGSLATPHGTMYFPSSERGISSATYDPFHEAGRSTQSRFDILTILGGATQPHMLQPMLDWELKASPTPYDNLQELAFEYLLGTLHDYINVEVVAFNVAGIDDVSTIVGTKAKLAVRLALGLEPARVGLGYRVFANGRVIKRSMLSGSEMQWEQQGKLRQGRVEIEVPPAAVLHCFPSYAGFAQSHYWVADPTTASNAKRVVYELVDNQLEILADLLTKSQLRPRFERSA